MGGKKTPKTPPPQPEKKKAPKKNSKRQPALFDHATTPAPMKRVNMRSQVSSGLPAARSKRSLLDPAVRAWLSQLSLVFSPKFDPVPVPVFEDSFPCPSVVVPNYGSTQLTSTIPSSNFLIHLFPGGSMETSAVLDADHNQIFAWNDSTAATHGSGMNVDFNGQPAALGCWVESSLPDSMTSTAFLNLAKPLLYDQLVTPVEYNAGDLVQVRTAGCGIRFTFDGELLTTKGYVEFVCPPEEPQGGTPFNTFRRAPSYRREFFANARTITFYWVPNCDDIKYTDELSHVATAAVARLLIRIGGLVTDDKVLVEYVTFQEHAGSLVTAVQQKRMQSHDAVHAVNALEMAPEVVNNRHQGQSLGLPSLANVAAHLKERAVQGAEGIATVTSIINAAKAAGQAVNGLV